MRTTEWNDVVAGMQRRWPNTRKLSLEESNEWLFELQDFGAQLIRQALDVMMEDGKERMTLPSLFATCRSLAPREVSTRPRQEDCEHPRFAFPAGWSALERAGADVVEMTCAVCLIEITKNVASVSTQGEVDGWVQ